MRLTRPPYLTILHSTTFEVMLLQHIPSNLATPHISHTCFPHISIMVQEPPPPPCLPYMEGLNFPDLRKLINDAFTHDLAWPTMPTKLPYDIPKIKGKVGEDPSKHVMSFPLWYPSNNIIEDSVFLRLFQQTLMVPTTKWCFDELVGT